MGLKSAAFPPDDKLADYFGDYAVQGVWADRDAMYYKEFEVDLAQVIPLVMEVGEINEIKAPGEWGRLEIQQGLIGACASGRLEDLRVVARILDGKKIASGFQLSIVPASREIYLQAIQEGIIDRLVKSGASILGSSCGPCLGSSHMIMADTRRFITTVNSNSMRRLSAIGVEKYVASPATVAMTALTGVLTVEVERTDAKYPYWEMPKVWVTVNEFERRYHNRVWNYGDLNSIACEQLFDEACTYRIAPKEEAFDFEKVQKFVEKICKKLQNEFNIEQFLSRRLKLKAGGRLDARRRKFRLWKVITTCSCRFKGGRYQSDYREIGGSPFF